MNAILSMIFFSCGILDWNIRMNLIHYIFIFVFCVLKSISILFYLDNLLLVVRYIFHYMPRHVYAVLTMQHWTCKALHNLKKNERDIMWRNIKLLYKPLIRGSTITELSLSLKYVYFTLYTKILQIYHIRQVQIIAFDANEESV